MEKFTHIQLNFTPGPHTRTETLDGKAYLVAPVVMLTVGVHNGNNGSILYTEKELSKTPESWNMKPLVVYHPTENGQGISACSPAVIEAQGIGMIMNATWDGKLRAEAWFDVEKTGRVDDRILNALENGEMMEVSTGLFTDNELTEGTFEPTDESYTAIAHNFRPDHLAILPDQKGACSIEDGAGLLQTNELSHSNTYSRLTDVVEERYGERAWVIDVYDSWFVFATGGKLFRLNYTSGNDKVTVTDAPPEAVLMQTVYRTVDGELIGNSTVEPTLTPPMENTLVNVKELANKIIANTALQFDETHREFLEAQSEDFLNNLAGVSDETPEQTEQEQETVTDNQTNNTQQPAQLPPAMTVGEFIASAPAGMREVLHNALTTHNDARAQLIQRISSNAQNQFTAEELQSMPHDQLKKFAAALSTPATTNGQQYLPQQPAPPVYEAAGVFPAPQQNAEFDESPLELPSMM